MSAISLGVHMNQMWNLHEQENYQRVLHVNMPPASGCYRGKAY